ncbi:glucose dehydrogenase [FAD, quinone]-like [Ischnura elegans]|uniref:glucose dehydrogenase [FAD, quinone]-like n=1 Tax=Ischnura elegans TaxID=197161 RepID=UPI001ED8BCD8|nr:glucose dehydrogenase [FAD, quinone]-like [Ischnura elegans]
MDEGHAHDRKTRKWTLVTHGGGERLTGRVLLLEAGGDELTLNDIPLLVALWQLTPMNWGYRTVYQEGMCGANKEGRCNWPRGKVLGGSSVLNYMIYTRGHPKDYDEWEQQGNRGWGFRDVLKYFKKSENAHIPGVFGGSDGNRSPYHSSGGYLDVEHLRYRTPLSNAYISAFEEIGIRYNPDYNGEYMEGMSYLQATTRNGSRVSSAKGFLRPVRTRSNLHVAKHCHVTKINIDPKTKRATGVEFQRHGRKYSVRANMEVILSAGAINSPQILMLSGVGPQDHLKEKGIAVIKHLPGVGENLIDHLSFTGFVHTIEVPYAVIQNRDVNFESVAKYYEHHDGPLVLPGAVENIGYIRTNLSEGGLPDVELIMQSTSMAGDNGWVTRRGIGITDEFYDQYFRPLIDRDSWTVLPVVMRPRSRGSIKLRNANPFTWPIMKGNYFEDPLDMEAMVAALQRAKSLGNTETMRKLGAKLYERPVPGCAHLSFGSDEYWRCAVRQLTLPLHHQCGTAKMGPATDKMAVVDDSLRVHGIKNLRVVDASIIPTMVAAHLYAPVLMIAEKASDMIKTTWRSV